MNNANETPTACRQPEDWPRLFIERISAGDVEGVIALYAPDAHFIAPGGETLVGRDRMRPVVAKLIDTTTQRQSQVIKATTVDDIAVLYTNFHFTTIDPSGKTGEIRQKALEVLRRQPDGTWLLIVGDPNGRAGEQS